MSRRAEHNITRTDLKHNGKHFVLHFSESTFNGVNNNNNNNDDDENVVIIPTCFLHEIVVYTDTAVYQLYKNAADTDL